MTEQEFAKLNADGQVKDVTPAAAAPPLPPQLPDQSKIPFSEWEPLLIKLRNSNLFDLDLTGGLSKLAEATLSSPANTLSSGSFAAKKFLRIIISIPSTSAGVQSGLQFNGDTGGNYDWNNSRLGGSTNVATGDVSVFMDHDNQTGERFIVMDVRNVAALTKSIRGSSAITATFIDEFFGRWTNTADQINSVQLYGLGGNTYAAGTEIAVFGSD